MKVLIYDSTVTGFWSTLWRLAAVFLRFDLVIPATRWSTAIGILLALTDRGKKVDQIQFWGRGIPGNVLLGGVPIHLRGVTLGFFAELRSRLHQGSVFWLRASDALAGEQGRLLAEALSKLLGCTVAGYAGPQSRWRRCEVYSARNGKLIHSHVPPFFRPHFPPGT